MVAAAGYGDMPTTSEEPEEDPNEEKDECPLDNGNQGKKKKCGVESFVVKWRKHPEWDTNPRYKYHLRIDIVIKWGD